MSHKAQLGALLVLTVTAAVAGTDVGIGVISWPMPTHTSHYGGDPSTYMTGITLDVEVPLTNHLALAAHLCEAGTRNRMQWTSDSAMVPYAATYTSAGLLGAGLDGLVLIQLPADGFTLRTGINATYVGSSEILTRDYTEDIRADATGVIVNLLSGVRVRLSNRVSIHGDIAVPALQWVNTTTTFLGGQTTYRWFTLAGSPPGLSLSVALTL